MKHKWKGKNEVKYRKGKEREKRSGVAANRVVLTQRWRPGFEMPEVIREQT